MALPVLIDLGFEGCSDSCGTQWYTQSPAHPLVLPAVLCQQAVPLLHGFRPQSPVIASGSGHLQINKAGLLG